MGVSNCSRSQGIFDLCVGLRISGSRFLVSLLYAPSDWVLRTKQRFVSATQGFRLHLLTVRV